MMHQPRFALSTLRYRSPATARASAQLSAAIPGHLSPRHDAVAWQRHLLYRSDRPCRQQPDAREQPSLIFSFHRSRRSEKIQFRFTPHPLPSAGFAAILSGEVSWAIKLITCPEEPSINVPLLFVRLYLFRDSRMLHSTGGVADYNHPPNVFSPARQRTDDVHVDGHFEYSRGGTTIRPGLVNFNNGSRVLGSAQLTSSGVGHI